ncbi:MAG: ribose 5-phosphate isomerase B [Bacillota bacterium]
MRVGAQDGESIFRRVAVGCDHGGYSLKETVREELELLGVEVTDFGTDSEESVDYPRFALAVAEAVSRGDCDAGVLLCGTGIGMAIAANKVPGVRAALCGCACTAQLARAHNDANVLTLGARTTGSAMAARAVRVFCTTPFDGGRHARRVRAIEEIESKYDPEGTER